MKTLNLDSSVINQKKPKIPRPLSVVPDAQPIPLHVGNSPAPKKRPSLFSKIFHVPSALASRFRSLSLAGKIIATVVCCTVILGGGAAIVYHLIIKEGTQTDVAIPATVPAEMSTRRVYAAEIVLSEPSPPKDTPNPINGELYTKTEYSAMTKRYPIAVMIENQVSARPQSGYNSADIVFETLAEGGITRSMAIFWGKNVPEIGPVRSARQYFIEWLMPFDPLYMHIGYAISDDPRINAGGSIYTYGIKSMDRYGTFWRSSERYAPHNAYTSSDLLYEKAEKFGYTGEPSPIESWSFKRDAPAESRGSGPTAQLVFFERLWNNGLYDITWTYDRETNTYLRFNNTTPYIDQNTETQVYAKNVIIQRVETLSAFDEKAHMIITTIGTGDAIILRDGMVINGTWKKDDTSKRTRYTDTEGKEIVFNRGIIWVEAVPIDQGNVLIGS